MFRPPYIFIVFVGTLSRATVPLSPLIDIVLKSTFKIFSKVRAILKDFSGNNEFNNVLTFPSNSQKYTLDSWFKAKKPLLFL